MQFFKPAMPRHSNRVLQTRENGCIYYLNNVIFKKRRRSTQRRNDTVTVPEGVTPGRSFALMAWGQRISYTTINLVTIPLLTKTVY